MRLLNTQNCCTHGLLKLRKRLQFLPPGLEEGVQHRTSILDRLDCDDLKPGASSHMTSCHLHAHRNCASSMLLGVQKGHQPQTTSDLSDPSHLDRSTVLAESGASQTTASGPAPCNRTLCWLPKVSLVWREFLLSIIYAYRRNQKASVLCSRKLLHRRLNMTYPSYLA